MFLSVRRIVHRPSTGTAIAELGPVLWILFFAILLPLLIFITTTVRYVFLLNAAHAAAEAGSQCKTFLANVSASSLSSTNMANLIADQDCAGFNGITIDTVTCNIVTCNFASSAVTRRATPLPTAADTNNNSYDLEVVITAQIAPVITLKGGFLGNVPGLTAPFTTTAHSLVVFENTQGLTQ